eukprot:symbB.v1.2.002212.t1/scaffold119.1/size318073/10
MSCPFVKTEYALYSAELLWVCPVGSPVQHPLVGWKRLEGDLVPPVGRVHFRLTLQNHRPCAGITADTLKIKKEEYVLVFAGAGGAGLFGSLVAHRRVEETLRSDEEIIRSRLEDIGGQLKAKLRELQQANTELADLEEDSFKRRVGCKRGFAWDDTEDVSDGGDDVGSHSSSGSEEEETPEGWESQKTMEIHSQVCPSAEYFHLREQSVETVIAPAAPCAPRGQAVVLRRWQRIKDAVANGILNDGRSMTLHEVAKQLRGRGFVVWNQFLGSDATVALLEGFPSLEWRPGRLGSAESRSLRGDSIAWPNLEATGRFGEALRRWMQALDDLVLQLRPLLNESSQLAGVSAREPPMASSYPRHARYIRHYDNNCDEGLGDCNGRRLTAVYYLNKGITHSDGGHLRILGQRGGVYDPRKRWWTNVTCEK